MCVVPSETVEQRLNELIVVSEQTRAAAAAAIARSEFLYQTARSSHRRALATRMASRPHRAYMRLRGLVDGQEVAAVVRKDGGVAGDRALLRRAELLVAMGEEFDTGRIQAAVGEGALAAALTLIRSCDEVRAVELALRGTDAAGRSVALGEEGARPEWPLVSRTARPPT